MIISLYKFINKAQQKNKVLGFIPKQGIEYAITKNRVLTILNILKWRYK
jgi:predicted SPOUT superfamily RNA methylase MTH1